MLVAAVLRPEEGEDRELEMVRIPAEQLSDSPRFPVRETEGAVERLIGEFRQVVQCIRGTCRRNLTADSRVTLD